MTSNMSVPPLRPGNNRRVYMKASDINRFPLISFNSDSDSPQLNSKYMLKFNRLVSLPLQVSANLKVSTTFSKQKLTGLNQPINFQQAS